MKLPAIAVKSFMAGLSITLISAIFPNTPYLLIGAVWYGYPLSWLTKAIVAPQFNPWRINYPYLVADLLFWWIVAAVVMYVFSALSKQRKIWDR